MRDFFVQAAKKDLFQEEHPNAVLFSVKTDSMRLSMHCALNPIPGQEGAYQLVGDDVGILPTVPILEDWYK